MKRRVGVIFGTIRVKFKGKGEGRSVNPYTGPAPRGEAGPEV